MTDYNSEANTILETLRQSKQSLIVRYNEWRNSIIANYALNATDKQELLEAIDLKHRYLLFNITSCVDSFQRKLYRETNS